MPIYAVIALDDRSGDVIVKDTVGTSPLNAMAKFATAQCQAGMGTEIQIIGCIRSNVRIYTPSEDNTKTAYCTDVAGLE